MRKAVDSVGERFGKLLVLSVFVRDQESYGVCKCDCGNETTVLIASLRCGKTNSCRCIHKAMLRKRSTSHGHTKQDKTTPTYRTWAAMISRCHCPTATKFSTYGGAGIFVCERWRLSFADFLADMGDRPPGKTIDRIDNSKGYFLENCRWLTPKQQSRNQNKNIVIEYNGFKKSLPEWCEDFNLPYRKVYYRYKRCGLPFEEVLKRLR